MLQPGLSISIAKAAEFGFIGAQGVEDLLLALLEHLRFSFAGAGGIDDLIGGLADLQDGFEVLGIFVLSVGQREIVESSKEIYNCYAAIAKTICVVQYQGCSIV